jgi:hypothetical protein
MQHIPLSLQPMSDVEEQLLVSDDNLRGQIAPVGNLRLIAASEYPRLELGANQWIRVCEDVPGLPNLVRDGCP